MQLSARLIKHLVFGILSLIVLLLDVPFGGKMFILAFLVIFYLMAIGVLKYHITERKRISQALKMVIVLVVLITAGVMATPFAKYGLIGVAVAGAVGYARFRLEKKIGHLETEEVEQRSRANFGSHGSAGYAPQAEVDRRFGTSEGLWLIDGFSDSADTHKITIASSGSGKNACVLIPALLTQPSGSYLIMDPKPENANITARYQQEQGQRVFIIDPWDSQTKTGATHGIKSSGFNPFDMLKGDMAHLNENCESVALYLVPDVVGDRDPFWRSRARSLVKNLLVHIITGRPAAEHNFWTLYKMLRLDQAAWEELLFDMKENTALDGQVSMAASELVGLTKSADKTLENIKSTAQDATTIFESADLRKSLQTSGFDPYELTKGDCTVYVVLPEERLDTHYTWLRMVVGLCLKACNSRPTGKRVHFMLDEFAILRAMPDVQRAFSFGRAQGVLMWIFAQNLSDLKRIYGEEGMNSMIGNAKIRMFFGVEDPYTQRVVSEMLGDTTIKTSSTSYHENGSSTSYAQMGRRLMTAEEVGKYEGVIMITPPLKWRAERVGYYENRFEKYLSDDPQYADYRIDSPELTDHERKLLKEGKLPVDWREIFIGEGRADDRPKHNRGRKA